jgi:hypothetical protein
MSQCSHKTLTLLQERGERLRCKRCHLVISAKELAGGCCPECYAEGGERHYDFEPVAAKEEEITKYRCEQCGAVIEWKVQDDKPT